MLLIYHYHRIYGIITSGSVFIITFFNALCSTVLLLDASFYNTSMYADIEISNIQRIFLCNLCLFIFACITDNPIDAGLKPSFSNKKSTKTDKKSLIDNADFDEENEMKLSPKPYASFISKLCFFWLNSFFVRSSGRILQFNDIYDLEDENKINSYSSKFNENFYKEVERIEKLNHNSKSKKVKLTSLTMVKIVFKTFGVQLLIANIFKFSTDSMNFVIPILLSAMIRFITDTESPKWHGALIAIGFVVTTMMRNIIMSVYNLRIFRIGMLIRSSLINLIYIKALKISSNAKRNHTTGEIVNLLFKF